MSLSSADQDKLDRLFSHLDDEADRFVGYPCNDRINYEPLHRLLFHTINNVGDPFVDSSYRLNTHEIEREVVSFFSDLFHSPKEDSWGYVTHGGTEGNMYGMYLACELYPNGIVYYSEETHYSVQKIMRLVGARSIMIRSNPNGSMDLEDLQTNIRLHRDVPAIVFVNIGTTMKGAIDDLTGIQEILEHERIRDRYVHCDAALSGLILPFVENPEPFDFRYGIDSIAVSGHKMIGSPMPCGVVVAKKRNVDRISRHVEYVASVDTTLAGSRNGITPVFLWYALRSHGLDGLCTNVTECLEVAAHGEMRFKELGLNAWRNPNSITVIFDRPPAPVLDRWSIAVQSDIAHVITMPHVSKSHIDTLAAELREQLVAV